MCEARGLRVRIDLAQLGAPARIIAKQGRERGARGKTRGHRRRIMIAPVVRRERAATRIRCRTPLTSYEVVRMRHGGITGTAGGARESILLARQEAFGAN